MSLEDGMAALNLEAPARVPRTEYGPEGHWELVKIVTGIDVGVDSSPELQGRARRAFCEAWNYDLFWSTLIGGADLAEKRTSMGHAVYAAGGVDWNEDISCPFKTPEEVLALDPWETYGERDRGEIVRRFEEHYRANCEANPGGVNMTGIYITCVSGLIDMFGWEMLLEAAAVDPKGFGDLTDRYCGWIAQYFEALAEADVPVVMIHDDMVWTSGAFIHPDWYRAHVFPSLRKNLAPVVESGKRVLFTSDGDYTAFLDDVVACGVHGFAMEPTTDMAYLAEKYGRTHALIGNADTRILLLGTKDDVRAEVKRCMDVGKPFPGFFLAVGNHIPPNTPVENCLCYNECYEEMSRR